ncbi:hypothetical protein CHY_0817 [Carboxydothermus hydrogenoformans Z-2901]|uniref:Uncharacterized protein n=1 Tax=Carboxydothermus hydrogenoformans (strain ATCC BAA-161 / DSM 6008 / Z-2901) TaxID=246194 RepID=Q3ADW3_CARHZ|nr:hypothetical protein CHY_0817 [Carboxydothermus hydrogenoformans Z-2901]
MFLVKFQFFYFAKIPPPGLSCPKGGGLIPLFLTNNFIVLIFY